MTLPSQPHPNPSSRVRISSPTDLLAAVPYLLGHQPAEALVLLCMNGAGVVTLSMHCGFPAEPPFVEGAGDPDEFAEELLAMLRWCLSRTSGARASHMVVVVYGKQLGHDRTEPACSSVRDGHDLSGIDRLWVADCRAAVADAGATLLDVLIVQNHRWLSPVCDGEECCPHHGLPVPGPADAAAVTAELVGQGLAPLPSRAAVAASVHPDRSRDDRDLVAAELAGLRSRFGMSLHDARTLLERAWAAVHAQLEGREGFDPLGRSERAVVILACDRRGVRDALIRRLIDATVAGPGAAVGGHMSRAVEVLLPALRSCPDGHVAGIASVVAVMAWQCGSGAQATAALERCLADDPDHRFGRLLKSVILAGIPPRDWAAEVVELDEGTCLEFDAAA